jgi:lipopolysaccharide export system protein LptA
VRFNDDNKATYIKAEGNVIIIQEDKRARGAVAEYYVDSGEITLTGNPMITSGKNIFTADIIKFWRDDNRMEGKPRSRLVIYPEGDGSRDRLFMEPARGR